MATRRCTSTLADLADDHDGVVTRRRLLAEGLDHNAVEDAIARRLLFPIVRGTYSIGRQTLTPRMLVQAATLHLAPAMVIGRSAAESREFVTARAGVVSVATERRRRSGAFRTLIPMTRDGHPGLVVFRPSANVARDSELVDGLRLSSVPRMLIDIAAAEPDWMLDRVWKQADYRGKLDLEALHAALERTRRRGAPKVRRLYERHPGRFGVRAHVESPHEIDFLQLIIEAGLPLPEVNAPVTIHGRRYVADFLWRLLGLVVELDDPSHERPLARQSDARRDLDFFVAGLDVVRFETQAVAADPPAAMRRLGDIIARQRQRAA